MGLFKKNNGAVSVFLVMILVPCIVVTSLFVEIGRVHMSKSMANSASDLALNSLLTNYDAELNEWYGLVASCQSIEEFYDVSAEYFLRTLSSQGLSEDEIYLLSDYYSDLTSDDSISDLLQVETITDKSDMISAVDGANLSNPTILKDDIVEFMKYRAPIELTTDLIDRFGSGDDSITEALEAEDNEPLVEKKTSFYEAEGELLAAAFNTYDAIRNYWEKANGYDLSNTKLVDYQNKINGYKTAYSKIHELTVSNVYNTSELTVYNRVTMAIDAYNAANPCSSEYVYSSTSTDDDGNVHYYVKKARIQEHLNVLENNITAFETAISNFNTATSSLLSTMPGDGDGQAYAIQWWVQMNNAVNSGSGSYTEQIRTTASAMLEAYSRVLAMENCELDEDVPDDWETTIVSENNSYNIATLKARVATLQSNYLTAGIENDANSYLKAVRNLEYYSSANINNIKSSNLKITVDGAEKSLDDAVPYIKGQLSDMRTKLDDCVKLLDIAIDGNESDRSVEDVDKVVSLDSLSDLATAYNSALNEWQNRVDVTYTTMASENQTEINGLESEMADKINAAAVSELKTRLTNIRSQLKSLISAIDSMTYGGTKLKEISDYSTFKSKTGTQVSASEIPLTNSALKTYVTTTFNALFAPTTSSVVTLSHTGDNNYDPRLDPRSGEVNIPELLEYLHGEFTDLEKTDLTEKKKELSDGESEGAKAAEDAKTKGRYKGGGSDIIKEFSGSSHFSLADGLKKPLELIQTIINGDITNIRDDLYATSYVMHMFSYATYSNEGKYGLVEDKTELTLGNYDTKYNALKGNAETEGTWLSEALTDFYNKSLTNKMINKENNVAHEAEIEYILYGGKDDQSNENNVKEVYSNIYTIRYALNLVSAFKNFWSGSNSTARVIEGVASAIQTATSGIIPIPLTKVVLLPILTIFETSKDLDRLEAGFPVEFFKVDDSAWWIKVPDGSSVDSVGGLTTIFKNSTEPNNADKGLFYSDYLTIFVYIGLSSADKAPDMYKRMAEIIQTNIKNTTGADSYSLTNSYTYFKLEATLKVKPLMINLPYFSGYDNNMSTSTGWCTYTISNTRGY